MSETSTLIGYIGRTIPREELALVPTPPATDTHRPVPHYEIVQALMETLGFRHTSVVHDEYAVSPDGMKMFGVLDLEIQMHGARFAIGLRNSHDKSMRLALVRRGAVYADQSTQGERGCGGTRVVKGLFFLLHYPVRR
jgi:hypothetical protein